VLGHAQRLEELFKEDLTGFDGSDLGHLQRLSVVINDLHVLWAGRRPGEAKSPLLVDPDAVLPGPAALERLQSVARRNSEVVQGLCGVQHHQLAKGDPFKLGVDPFRSLA